MSRDPWVSPHIQRLFETGSLSGLSEWQLVERYVRNRDQAAFELLVARHGPMVFGVCRRILHDLNDVEDAFQATFLVLVRRAPSLGPRDVVAAWLHGVALKVARRARFRRERLLRRERSADGVEPLAPSARDADFALRAVLDEEIDRLPWKYRAPVALCYLQGLTYEEAARQLGWPIGTVKGRLARARSTLGARLSRRGITSVAGAVAGSMIFDSSLQAAPSESLVAAAARASARIADGRAWDAVVSTSIADLVRGVFTAMMFSKLKVAAALLLVSGLTVTGAGVYGRQQGGAEKPEPAEPPPAVEADRPRQILAEPPRAAEENAEIPPPHDAPIAAEEPTKHAGEPSEVESDSHAKALPPIEAEPLQRQLADAADRSFQASFTEFREKQVLPDRVYRASRLLLDAQLETARNWAARVAAYEKHLKRMDALAKVEVLQRNGNVKSASIAAEARAFLAEAALWLAKSRSGQPLAKSGPRPESPVDSKESNPATIAILAKLEEPLAMNFPSEQPLEDVLKYIKQATQGPSDRGIPIYVDPIGLQEAEKTLTSPISIDLEGVPLRRTLQLMLKQIGLAYFVDDGLLVITSEASIESKLPPSMMNPSPLLEKQEKARRGELGMDEIETLIMQIKLINEMEALLKTDKSGMRGASTPPRTPNLSAEQASGLIEQLKALTEALKATQQSTNRGGFQ